MRLVLGIAQLAAILLVSDALAMRAIRRGPDEEGIVSTISTGRPGRFAQVKLQTGTTLAEYEHAVGNKLSSQAGASYKPQSSASSIDEDFVDHFSAQTTETATYLHNLYKPPPNSSALAYSVTSSRSILLYNYLFSPENQKHLSMQAIDESQIIKYQFYFPSSRKRLGGGTLAYDIKYAGWRIQWRGVEMEVYVTNWVEGTYQRRSQTHVSVFSLPTSWNPASALPELYKKIQISSPHNVVQNSQDEDSASVDRKTADQAISLFLLEVGDFNARIKDAVLVFEQSEWREDAELWENVQKANWADVILSDEMKANIRHEYKSFFASEKIYKDLGVPWKRGVIFLGPPGNGKTITLKAMMKDSGAPILYVKSLHTYAGDELGIRMVFERARQEAPCLLIFEDLDSLITENNRSFFLNEVDGLEDNDGLLLIGTTNHFDKLDTALSNRPSRFDRKYFFPNPTQEERVAYAKYWRTKLESNPRIDYPESLVTEFADKTYGFSFAYLKEVFVSALLTLAADEKNELDFQTVLMKQIAALRKDLDSDKGGKEKVSKAQSGKQDAREVGRSSFVQMLPQILFPEVDPVYEY